MMNKTIACHDSPRKWSMRFAAIAIALSPFLLIEASLRIFAPVPAAMTAVDRDPYVDLHQLKPLFVYNGGTDRWEIPPERSNFFRPASFLADKEAGSRRIFVLGGSTVQGRPFATETAFSTWLRLRLESSDPKTTFEVVNCGGVSYASYRVARILDEVLQHQPDAIVLYIGHNEFLEDREYATVREMNAAQQLATRLASKIRTVTWLREKTRGATTPRPLMPDEVDARLDHIGGLDQYHRDPSWRMGVERHFAKSLQRMIWATETEGVPIVVCVPARELVETPPFKIATNTSSEKQPFKQAWEIARSGTDVQQRLAATSNCLSIDPEHAGAHYIAGRLLYQQGETDRAIQHLTAAVDFDVCPLRATTPILEAVTIICQRNDVGLIDTCALLDQRDRDGNRLPDGIADPEFFVDHVHPTVAGHQLIGAAIAKTLDNLGWSNGSVDAMEAESRYQKLAAQHLATLGEDYYARGRQRLRGLRQWAAGRAKSLEANSPSETRGE